MKQRGKGFYIFCALCVCLAAVIVWSLVSSKPADESTNTQTLELGKIEADVPPAHMLIEAKNTPQTSPKNQKPLFDET